MNRIPRVLSAANRRRSGAVSAKSGTAQSESQALRRRKFQVTQRVIQIRHVMFRMLGRKPVGPLPQGLGAAEPRLLFRREGFGRNAHAPSVAAAARYCLLAAGASRCAVAVAS